MIGWGQDEEKQGVPSAIGQASANAASLNILAIFVATMSAPGEQGKRSALILKDPGSTHNLITHKLADLVMLPSQATSEQGAREAEGTRTRSSRIKKSRCRAVRTKRTQQATSRR